MVNKKILILIFFGILFFVGFSEKISADWNQKVDWNKNPFEWNSALKYSQYSPYGVVPCDSRSNPNHGSNEGYGITSSGSNLYWAFFYCDWDFANWKMDWVSSGGLIPPTYVTCTDSDSDNYASIGSHFACGVSDCDDNNAQRKPGLTEDCGDELDNNCNGVVNEDCPTITYCSDNDGDGYVALIGGCTIPAGKQGGDCDDGPNTGTLVNPGATEFCGNGINDDCVDGDLACPSIPCTDADNDDYCVSFTGCNPTNICTKSGDCDDTLATGINIHPEATENCIDDIDNNCNTFKDCADNFCKNKQGSGGLCQVSELNCDDGFDNDGDGKTDYADNICGGYWANDNQGTQKITQKSTQQNLAEKVYLIFDAPTLFDTPNVNQFGMSLFDYKFEIWERDISGEDDAIRIEEQRLAGTPSGNKIIAEWTITPADIAKATTEDPNDNIYEFYFKLNYSLPFSLVQPITALSSKLSLEWQTGGPQTLTCLVDGSQNPGETGIDCGGSTCPACVVGESCNDDDDCQPGEICANGVCEVDCSQYILCSDYGQNLCGNDPCSVSILDGCLWSGTSCNVYENLVDDSDNVIGTCEYTEDTTDDCDDEILEYSLSLTSDSSADCEKKDPVSIFCSAQTSLPLENKFGILLTIISIIGIYFIFYRKNKHLKKW